uniref:Complexin 4c n=1 Tax=Scophthalmus maximus TaxID=52904 RepID=A0A8D3BUE3_SCOMX
MAFLVNQMPGDELKSFTGGGAEEDTKAGGHGKEAPESQGMSRAEFEEYQRQLVEEKIERDKDFAMRKAERANLRVSAQDTATVRMAGDDVDLPEDLAKMADEDEGEEETTDSLLHELQNMDMDTLKTKAQATATEIMKQTNKCMGLKK